VNVSRGKQKKERREEGSTGQRGGIFFYPSLRLRAYTCTHKKKEKKKEGERPVTGEERGFLALFGCFWGFPTHVQRVV
jgi:hypothetical protein